MQILPNYCKRFPIKITIKEGYRILDAKIIYQKNIANSIKEHLNSENNEVIISFDYLDFEDGFVLQIFHTADSSDEISVNGTIKTVRKLERRSNTDIVTGFMRKFTHSRNVINILKFVNSWNIVVLGVLLMITALLPESILMPSQNKTSLTSLRIVFIILGILYTYLGYSRVKRGIPKGYPK